jgi:hypothetical protein
LPETASWDYDAEIIDDCFYERKLKELGKNARRCGFGLTSENTQLISGILAGRKR